MGSDIRNSKKDLMEEKEDEFVWVSSKYVESLERNPSVSSIVFWSMLWLLTFVAIVFATIYFSGR
jgi:hypothetical protein